MTEELVLTAIAGDRPGLVEALAEVITNHQGNWIDSSMARLGGEFAGILRVAVPKEQSEDLRAALGALTDQGITVSVRRDRPENKPTGSHATLEVTGQDQTGIVLEISRVLAQHGVSYDELRTKVFTGSMGGATDVRSQCGSCHSRDR